MAEEVKHLEYMTNLVHERIEVGNISPKDLAQLVYQSPLSNSPTSFSMSFRASDGIPGTYGKILLRNGGFWQLDEVRYTPDLNLGLAGGRLERLNVDFPKFLEEIFDGGKALDSFKDPARLLEKAGYEIDLSFKIFHHVVKTTSQHPGFPGKTISGKLALTTEPMVKGSPERKLVLQYTHDMTSTPEFDIYKSILEGIKNPPPF